MSRRPVALITGITGQDGSFLAEQLIESGYTVVGLVRHSASPSYWRIQHLFPQLRLRKGDLLDLASLIRIIQEVSPDYIYNLASQSFVPTSWHQPLLTADVTAVGALRLFEAVRLVAPEARIYQASSSEMFGNVEEEYQNEASSFQPCSPYGCSKLFAHQIMSSYRREYGLFAVGGILFNHESERRGAEFVTRKIAMGVASIKLARQSKLTLGSLAAERDWGFAGDYTKAMRLMLEAETAQDFVIASGRKHSVQMFLEAAFDVVELDWRKYTEQA
jgi:GDPmannose 4,6-dehydratase